MTNFDQQGQHIENQYNAGENIYIHQTLNPLNNQQRYNRSQMLRRVQSMWVEGVLEPSLYCAAQITLTLQQKPNAIVSPRWSALAEFNQTKLFYSSDVSIEQIYERADREILILGEPGSGKTTLLLQLARDLLRRAHQDERQPIPVIFSLSSWTVIQCSFEEWLVSELHIRYQIPYTIATNWIKADQILPLLDGLDEITSSYRHACIKAINLYRQGHGLLPIVVCSRKTEYEVLSNRLHLRTAVIVQPLTQQQIKAYLSHADTQTELLYQVLQQDAELRSLATTPLMLNILAIVYKDISYGKERNSFDSYTSVQKQVFTAYVQRMLRRRINTHFLDEQVLHWLSWLAQQMKQHGQTEFYLEQLQPDWLSHNRTRYIYESVAVRFPNILIGAFTSFAIQHVTFSFSFADLILSLLLGGLLGWLFGNENLIRQNLTNEEHTKKISWHQFLQWLGISLFIGSGVGLSSGLLRGLCCGLYIVLLQLLLTRDYSKKSNSLHYLKEKTLEKFFSANKIFLNSLLVGLPLGLLYGLSDGLRYSLEGGLLVGVIYGMIYGLIGGVLSALLLNKSVNVQPTDRVIWSWKSLTKSIFSKQHVIEAFIIFGLLLLSFGLSFGLIIGPFLGLDIALSFGLSIGLVYWLVLGIIQGVSSETIQDQSRLIPNQGIHNSAINCLVLGLVCAIIFWLVGMLSEGLAPGLSTGLQHGLVLGLFQGIRQGLHFGISLSGLIIVLGLGLIVGLFNGGLAYLRHYILRYLLLRTRVLPWNYIHFLNTATEGLLLRKVGGGYIFIHRLLLEYFADIGVGSYSSKSQYLLPCGHVNWRSNAHYCGTCGTHIPSE